MTMFGLRRPGACLLVPGLLGLGACGTEALDTSSAMAAALAEEVVLTEQQLNAAGLETLVVRPVTLGVPLRVPGTVATPDTAVSSLGSIVEGQVGRIRVVVGDRVPAGAELLRIHSHELTDALRDSQAATALATYRRSALERSRVLYAAGAVSREEVEWREAEHEAAAAEVRRSAEWVRHLTPSPEGDIVVRAPRAGVVFAVHVRPGAVVTPGAPLVEIGGTDVLWVHGFVPEGSAIRLGPGSGVSIELPAFPGLELAGRIVRMGELVDPLRRAVEVRVELESFPEGVRPGMFATILIPGPGSAGRALLPAEAVQRVGGREIVFLETEAGRYLPQAVRSEAMGDGMLAVDGLAAGATVVTRGAYTLRSLLEGITVE
jgi:membrane fusion protein, heavy metal efflux system